MATRIYFRTSAAPITPSAWGAWTDVTGTPVTVAGTTARGGDTATSIAATSGAVAITRAFGRMVYGPIGAHTFTGQTLKGQMRGSEANAAAQCSIAIAARILTPAGAERAVLFAPVFPTGVDTNPPELRTTLTNNKFREADADTTINLASVSSQNGDYLVIEWGVRKNAASTARTITFSYGAPSGTTDLAEDDTTTTANNPWVEFSTTITAWTPSGSGTVALTLGTAGEGRAVHYGSGTDALSLAASGTGEAPAVAIPEGSGLAALTLDAVGVGATVRSGQGTDALVLAASGAGVSVRSGAGVDTLLLGAEGAGVAAHYGPGLAALTLAAEGVGEAPASVPEGFGTVALVLGTSGEGRTIRSGAGAPALVLDASGTGDMPAAEGFGLVALTLGADGVGQSQRAGSGLAALTLLAAGVGTSLRTGSGLATLTLHAQGRGIKPGGGAGLPQSAPVLLGEPALLGSGAAALGGG